MKLALTLSAVLHLVLVAALSTGATGTRALVTAQPLVVTLAVPRTPTAPRAHPATAAPRPATAAPLPQPERPLARAGRPAATAAPTAAPAAAPAAAAPPTGEPATTRTVNHLRALITSALAAHFTYPRLAREYGWQGRVHVDVRVENNGRVHPLRVARSSGHSVLDRHALDTLAHIGTLPALAHWSGDGAVDVELPIEYRLVDGQS